MKYFDEKRKVKVTIMNKEKEVTQEKLEDIYNSLFNKLNEKIPFPEEFSRNIQAYAKTMANKVFEETKTREDIAKGKEILDSIVDKRKLAKIVFQEAEDKEKKSKSAQKHKKFRKVISFMVSAQQRPLIDYTETNTISSKALSSFHKLSTEELIALLPKVGEEYLEKINSILTERAVKDPSIQEDIKNADEISKRIYDESEKEELLIKKDNCELLRKIIKDMDTAEEMDLLTTGGFSYDALENIKYLSSKQLIALSTIVYDERYMTEIQKNLGSMAGKDEYLMKLVKSQEDRDDHSVPDDNSGHNDR